MKMKHVVTDITVRKNSLVIQQIRTYCACMPYMKKKYANLTYMYL